jgi:hypothetical protein
VYSSHACFEIREGKNYSFSITNRLSLIPLRPEENSFILLFENCILINNFSSAVCLHNLKMFIQFCFSIFFLCYFFSAQALDVECCVNSKKRFSDASKNKLKLNFFVAVVVAVFYHAGCFVCRVQLSLSACFFFVQVHSHFDRVFLLLIFFLCYFDTRTE